MHTTARLATAGLILAAMTGPADAAGKASGYFRLDKTRSEFSNACAFRLPDPSGATPGVTPRAAARFAAAFRSAGVICCSFFGFGGSAATA